MKRLSALFVLFAFTIAMVSVADAAKAKKAIKKPAKKVVTKKVAPKKVAPAPVVQPVAPAPVPVPVAPVAPRPVPVAKAAPSAGLLGMGINTGVSGGYIASKSIMLGRADLILADPLGLGPLVGLSDKAVAWKIGLGGGTGKDKNDVSAKIVPLFVDGIINLPADLLGGIESYIGGGVNYVLYGTGKKTGSYGGQVYGGVQGDLGLGGKSYVEVGYSVIRSGASAGPYSVQGIGLNVGTQILL